ncbi:MAG TPA: EamA family transporter [Thermoleophilaceae bacterium]
MRSSGTIFSLASGAAFGSMAIFGKLAYDEGANVGTLLAVRFTVGAALFWVLVLAGGALSEARGLRRRDIGLGLALGAAGYAAQAGLYFVALERIDASILALLLYTFPAMVTVTAVALGRDRITRRRLVALALTSVGLILVLTGATGGGFDALGAVLALGAAVVYTTYILSSQGAAGRISPYLLSALVCTGAAITLTLGASLLGQLHPADVSAKGWLWLAGIGVVSTVAAIGFFFAGLRRVGPTSASILATVEPVVTVLLAFLVFGETLAAVQVLGAALVLTSVIVLQARSRSPEPVLAS